MRMTPRGPGQVGLLLWAVLSVGCATVSPKPAESFEDWYEAVDGATAPRYDIGRVEQDLSHLENLLVETRHLSQDILQMRRRVRFLDQPYMSQEESHDLALLLRRVLNLRASLGEVARYYRTAVGPDPDTQARGSVLGLNAGAADLALGAHLVATFLEEKQLVRAANSAYPRYEIPERTFDGIVYEVTHPMLAQHAMEAHRVYSRALADPGTALAGLSREDPALASLIGQGELTFADAWLRVHYIKTHLGLLLPEFDNQVRHSAIARVKDNIWWAIRKDADHMRGLVFKNVARIKQPDSRLTLFTDEQRQALYRRLQPGDILLTYTAGYMSNIFLPGQFKHGIIYVGDPPMRVTAGLTEPFLADFSVGDKQRDELVLAAGTTRTRAGRPGDVIEAVAEGVKFSSLDYLLDTHVSRLAVLRPRLDPPDRQQQLAATLAMLGVPYDFKFDFSDPTYLCCTELVYRVLEGKGPFALSLSRTRGHWVITADDLAVAALENPARPFEILMYAEADPGHVDARARVYEDEAAERRLRELFAAED